MTFIPPKPQLPDGPGPMLAGSATSKSGLPARNRAAEKLARALIETYRPKSIHDLKTALQDILGEAVNGLLDAELDVHLDSENENREPGEKYNRKNGHTGKTVRTSDGPLRIRVPRDRDSTFQPEIVPKHSRDISELESKILPMYARGMSQRDIADTLEEIYGCRVSHETVSKIAERAMEDVVKWQNRPLKPFYAFVFVDCIYASVRCGHGEKASDQAIYVMLGIDLDGHKEILALSATPAESKSHWMNLFDSLHQRGVQDILFVSMDGVSGLEEGVKAIFPGTVVQRCIVHLMRSSLKYVARKDYAEFSKDIKAVYTAVSVDECNLKFKEFKERWSAQCPGAVRVWESHFDHVLQLFNYPSAIRKIMYTTNAIESVNSSLRKVTKKGSFDSYDALFRAFYLRIQELSKKWEGRSVHGWAYVRNQLVTHEQFAERVMPYLD